MIIEQVEGQRKKTPQPVVIEEERKDNKQEIGMRKRKIPSMMEGMYGRRGHLGEQGKSQKCK